MIRVGKSGNDYVVDGVTKKNGGWLRSLGMEWARGVGRPGAWYTRDRAVFEHVLKTMTKSHINFAVFSNPQNAQDSWRK